MIYINLDDYKNKETQFYLGIEEYYLKNSDEEYFLAWSTCPSVIFGANQIMNNEINLEYVKENNINICRRLSGGGAVYADENNLMYTFILNLNNYSSRDEIFEFCLSKICKVFKEKLNLDVSYSGRNDLLFNGAKISGSSFYFYGNRVIFHGTLLYDVDVDRMVRSLNPKKEKLTLKGIESIRQRVVNLKDYTSYSLLDIKKALIEGFCDQEIVNIPFDLVKPYQDHLNSMEYIYGKEFKYNISNEMRFNNGFIKADISVIDQKVAGLRLSGDFFSLKDTSLLINRLINISYQKDEIYAILKDVDVSDFILGLNNKEFISLITKGE